MRIQQVFAVMLAVGTVAAAAENSPLALHPDNQHYFLFRGRPTVLVSSGEHYGAVLNLDFDFRKYLAELEANRLNHTRTFSGAYCEPAGAFRIARNTLAPEAGRFICPWARSDVAGYANGGNKFDLAKWDDAYFSRLKEFVAEASKRNIVVELNLFCPFYEDAMWQLSPMNAANNVNGVGDVNRNDVYTLDRSGGLLERQEAMVRKIVAQLRDFDNIYFEVCNEPYARKVSPEWQRRIVDVIADVEREFPHKHLVSLNVANKTAKIVEPDSAVSIFNFHYAVPPTAVTDNYGLNRPIGDNETGFRGTADEPYRREAWEFLLAGGALFSHLDYSFAVGHEDGSFRYPNTQPGAGSREFRQQMRVLREFMDSLDFVRMEPDNEIFRGDLPDGTTAYWLAEHGRQYAAYVFGAENAELALELPAGEYDAEWINVLTGAALQKQRLSHTGGVATLRSPPLKPDVALRIRRIER